MTSEVSSLHFFRYGNFEPTKWPKEHFWKWMVTGSKLFELHVLMVVIRILLLHLNVEKKFSVKTRLIMSQIENFQ